MHVGLRVSLCLVAMVVSLSAVAAGKSSASQKPATLPDGSPAPSPPPEPPKPGHMPKMSPHEQLVHDVFYGTDKLRDAVEGYFTEHHAWPKSIDEIPDANKDLPASIQSFSLDPNGVIRVQLSAKAPGVGGKFALFTPQVSDGKTIDVWKCTSPDVPEKDSPCPPH